MHLLRALVLAALPAMVAAQPVPIEAGPPTESAPVTYRTTGPA